MPFSRFKKDVRDFKRLEQIAGVFVKYGFGFLVEKMHLPVSDASKDDLFHLAPEVRLRKVFEELGPTFIKLGQMLSLRPEVIPYPYCKELEKLQDEVPPVPFEKIRDVVEEEFGKPIDKVFGDFPRQSVASASLAQVYQVRIKKKEAMVKVQKPGVEELIKTDLEILVFLAGLLERHAKESLSVSPIEILDEFKTYILRELNFSNEVMHTERFRRNFRGSSTIYFPSVYKKFCTSRVFVAEKIKGVKINDLEKIRRYGLDTGEIARDLANGMLKQIFIDGFFHADPHPGNIFVAQDGRICFLDFGIIGRIDEVKKFKLADILIAAIEKDAERIMAIFRNLGALEKADERQLRLALEELLEKYYGVSLEEFSMEGFFLDFAKVLFDNKVKIQPDYILLLKTLSMIEGIGKVLDPKFNVSLQTRRFAENLIKEKYSPRRVGRRLKIFGRNALDLVQDFPQDLTTIIGKIKRGELKVDLEHTNLDNLVSMLDKTSARISFSLIIAALIIGSSVVLNVKEALFFGQARQLAAGGFVIAGILGAWLLIHMLRSGRL